MARKKQKYEPILWGSMARNLAGMNHVFTRIKRKLGKNK